MYVANDNAGTTSYQLHIKPDKTLILVNRIL